jgi:hypothetical protein
MCYRGFDTHCSVYICLWGVQVLKEWARFHIWHGSFIARILQGPNLSCHPPLANSRKFLAAYFCYQVLTSAHILLGLGNFSLKLYWNIVVFCCNNLFFYILYFGYVDYTHVLTIGNADPPSRNVGLMVVGLMTLALLVLLATPVMALLASLLVFLVLVNAISLPKLWAAL